jgi:hypothetical protein
MTGNLHHREVRKAKDRSIIRASNNDAKLATRQVMERDGGSAAAAMNNGRALMSLVV